MNKNVKETAHPQCHPGLAFIGHFWICLGCIPPIATKNGRL